MKKILTTAKDKYFVTIGSHKLSPILEASTVLGLDYCEKISSGKLDKNYPYFFCFPDKKSASLWLSIAVLTNYFLEDYVESNNKIDIDLENGSLVDIYGSVARFIREDSTSGELVFSFKDSQVYFPKSICNVIKETNKNAVNKHQHFVKARKEAKSNRNAISQVLLPKDVEIINEQVLQSKVLLVSGRGKMKVFKNSLHDIRVNDEKLSHIFPENKNLIIKPDLESFKNISNSKYLGDCDIFIRLFEKLRLQYDEDEEIKANLSELNNLLIESGSITSEFHNEFLSFCNDFDEEDYPKLKLVKSKYPGYQEILPPKLRAVIINDIHCIFNYSDTINSFLENNIPVIFVSDRKVEKSRELDTYSQIFNAKSEYLRINWNRKKIVALREFSDPISIYLDNDLWSQCIKYSNQKIHIEISEGNEIDDLLPIVQKKIAELDEFQLLKKAFFNKLYPAIYAIKNSTYIDDSIKELIIEFKDQYDELKHSNLDYNVKQIINTIISEINNYSKNSKTIPTDQPIFSNIISKIEGKNIFIPVGAENLYLPKIDSENIIFSGFPYKEYSGQYLLNSVFDFFIPDIKILCWPGEGELTNNFLKRRLMAGYFTDNLLDSDIIDRKFLLTEKEEIESEVDEYLIMEGVAKDNSLDQEEILEELHSLRFAGYVSGDNGNNKANSTVKCDVINFIGETFMFLPKGAKILSERETVDGRAKIMNLKFNELTEGMRIFKFKKDRAAYREISKQNKHINQCFEKLEIWRNSLEKSYVSSGKNLGVLESKMKEVQARNQIKGGNPDLNNLKRWLYDEEIIAPDTPNLRLILLSQNIENLDVKMKDLAEAYRAVLSYTIGLSSKIKRNIRKQLLATTTGDDSLKIEIDGTPILIETKTISGLEKNNLTVEYANSRKVLC